MRSAEIDAAITRRARRWGRKGGYITAEKLREKYTPEQMSAKKRAAANARWAAVRKAREEAALQAVAS